MSSKVAGFRSFAGPFLVGIFVLGGAAGCGHRTSSPAAYGAFAESPSYDRVLVALRNARERLTKKGHNVVMQNDQDAAIAAIDRATAILKRAAETSDGGAAQAVPPANAGDPEGQLHKALDELRTARTYVEHDARSPNEKDLRRKLLHELGEAIRLTNSAIQAASRGS